MLDVYGTILVGVASAVILTAIVTSIPLRLSGRLVVAGAAGAWIGFAGAVAGAGALSNPLTVLAMFGTPLATTAALVFAIPAARRVFSAVPLPLLVGLNVIRVGGVLFVLLAFAGRLSGPFPYSAGWGDFVTGAFAIPIAWLAASETRVRDRLNRRVEHLRHPRSDRRGDPRSHLKERMAPATHPCRCWLGGDDDLAVGVR